MVNVERGGESKEDRTMLLLGHYVSKVNEKGRVALPAKYKQVLGERVVLARWYESCLAVVAERDWEKIVGSLGEQRLVEVARGTDRFLLSGAFEIILDEQGRFVIPQVLREYAKLTGEIVFAGVGNRVEIWDRESFEQYEVDLEKRAPALMEKFLGKGE